MKYGQYIFYKNIPNFLSWIQRVVTGTIYSHVSIAIGWIQKIQRELEFDADLKIRFHSFPKRSEYMDVLQLVGVPHRIREKVINEIVEGYENLSYGYIQWLTIGLRFLFEKMGYDAKGWNILWGWGVTCSELTYYDTLRTAEEMMSDRASTDLQQLQWGMLVFILKKYNPNLFVPEDYVDIQRQCPDLMRWV